MATDTDAQPVIPGADSRPVSVRHGRARRGRIRKPSYWRRRGWLDAFGVVVALAVALVGVMTLAFVFPTEEEPAQVDAIVVLGGLSGKTVIPEAIRLAEAGYSNNVVISNSFGGDVLARNLCEKPSSIAIECIEPRPVTTQGEARAIEALAAERGWDRVMVVTTVYHVTRARVLIERCYDGGLLMIGADPPMKITDWAYQYAYQSAGLVKAWLNPEC